MTPLENTAVLDDERLADQEAGSSKIIDVDFGTSEAADASEKTMHGNLVYSVVEEDAEQEIAPDPEVYEAARRLNEGRYFYRFVKRAFDIVFSGTVIVLFCWLYAIIAIAIKIDDPKGPVIFKQERVEQVIIRHNFGSCLLNIKNAWPESGFRLVSNKSKCAFGERGECPYFVVGKADYFVPFAVTERMVAA